MLAALAVLSIALTALVLATIEYTSNTGHLKDKMIAHWVAMNKLAEVRVGLIELPAVQRTQSGTVTMADNNWYWTMKSYSTTDDDTLKVEVNVGKDDKASSITHIIGFISQAE